MGFNTKSIHAGQKAEPITGALITPIFMTSTYKQIELGKHTGYEYGRTQNPTREAYEKNISVLEKGKYGIAFSSGLAAINALMGLVKSGDHIIISNNVYGGTYRLLENDLTNYGLEFSWVDTSNLSEINSALKENTKIVYVETPTNPMLNLTDISEVAKFCKQNNLISIVDNTFMSPYSQNPLELGADIVVHSSTKYINGHCDVVGGVVITSSDEIHERVRYLQNAAGAVPSPFDCWLTLRAIKTLGLRMKQQNENALKFAQHIQQQYSDYIVYYPGLESHPQHELAKTQMNGFGGIVSVDFKDYELTKHIADNLKVFTLAESLGGVESLICHPASMTHAAVPKTEREKFGLTDTLLRFSVGIEDIEDLIEDVEKALKTG